MAVTPDPKSDFGPWTVADEIVGPAVVSYLEDDAPADFTAAPPSTGWLIDPEGFSTSVTVGVAPDDPAALEYTLGGQAFDLSGVWSLQGVVNVAGNTFRLAPFRFVV